MFFNRYLQLRVNDEFKSISYFCDVYLGGFIEILSVSSIFTHIFFSIKIHSTPKSHFKSDQNLGERCLLQCNTDFLDCTKDCDNEPSERECLQECNRTVVACSNGLFTDRAFFSAHMIKKIQIVHVNLTARKDAAIAQILFARTQFQY